MALAAHVLALSCIIYFYDSQHGKFNTNQTPFPYDFSHICFSSCHSTESPNNPRSRLKSLPEIWNIVAAITLLWIMLCNCVCTQMFSHVWLFAIPWTVARQAPLPMRFSWQKDWSGLTFPAPGDHLDPGIEHSYLMSPALISGFFTTSAT